MKIFTSSMYLRKLYIESHPVKKRAPEDARLVLE